MTSDAGLALLNEFMGAIGFSRMAKDAFGQSCSLKTYDNADLLAQKILMLLCGYGTDDEADHLAHDPMFRLLLGKKRLASQPTLSRFVRRLDESSVHHMEKLNWNLLRLAYQRKPPENIVLDVDTTLLPTYGKQEGGAYVYHYDAVGFHPIAVFDGLTGDLVRVELRKGNHYCGKDADMFLKPVLEAYDRDYPGTNVLMRGDSGFATPKLYDLVESYGYQYVIRLKQNQRLVDAVKDVCDEVTAEAAKSDKTYFVRYCEFKYQAASWSRERRVVCRIELHKREEQSLFPDSLMFIVTNLDAPMQEVVAAYCKRGTMENFFKEAKNEFAFTHMSSRSMLTNSNRLWIAALAYTEQEMAVLPSTRTALAADENCRPRDKAREQDDFQAVQQLPAPRSVPASACANIVAGGIAVSLIFDIAKKLFSMQRNPSAPFWGFCQVVFR